MPAFLTHYSFGVEGYRTLKADSSLKACIKDHSSAYAVGLAGPDLFFYSVYELLRPGMTIGRIMHKYRTGAFLRALFEAAADLTGENERIALAYAAGFVGHYCLDASAHPLVYRICRAPSERQALGKHFRYEAAMDEMCCRQVLGREIKESGQMSMIRMTWQERRVTASVLSAACRRTYPEEAGRLGEGRLRAVLHEYYLINGLLIDPTGFLEWCLQGLEQRTLGYVLASPLFINQNHYSLTEKDWKRFRKRYDRGLRQFVNLLPFMERAVAEAQMQDHKTGEGLAEKSPEGFAEKRAEKYTEKSAEKCAEKSTEKCAAKPAEKCAEKEMFFGKLGSRSYHTGTSCESSKTEKLW